MDYINLRALLYWRVGGVALEQSYKEIVVKNISMFALTFSKLDFPEQVEVEYVMGYIVAILEQAFSKGPPSFLKLSPPALDHV